MDRVCERAGIITCSCDNLKKIIVKHSGPANAGLFSVVRKSRDMQFAR